MPEEDTISVSEAARRLGVSESTVRNWLRQGRLRGQLGHQPVRPRSRVLTDRLGHPIGHDGRPVMSSSHTGSDWDVRTTLEQRVSCIEQRLSTLESVTAAEPGTGERFRDAALQLNAAMDHQRRAFQLQLEATKALDEAVAEQAQIIAGLLVGDPNEVVARPSSGH